MAFRNLIKCRIKGITSNILNLRTAEVFSQNVRLFPLMPRMLLRPYSRWKLRKDSDFEHTGDGEPYEYSEEALTGQLDDKMRELKSDARFTRKIMTKKSVAKREKQPRMLTFCEILYIKELHSSNPDEWTPEILSECFPALPYMIRTILKSNWKPESVERVKFIDKLALENWEKLKRNELKVSPEYHDHLKKFINKSNVLKLQINNPNFSYLPSEKSVCENGNGDFTSLISDYEEELSSVAKAMANPLLKGKLKENQLSLTDGTANALILRDDTATDLILRDGTATDLILRDGTANDSILRDGTANDSILRDGTANDLILRDGTANVLSFKESNRSELKAVIKQKGLIQEWKGSIRAKGRPVTLDELKQSIFRKAEKCLPLSESDIELIKNTLTRHHLPPLPLTGTELAVCSDEINEEALSKATDVKPRKSKEEFEGAPFKSTEKKPMKIYEEMKKTEKASHRNKNLGEEESPSEEDKFHFPNLFKSTQLSDVLNRLSKTSLEKEEETSKREKKPVDYYGTERDKLIYQKLEEDIYQTTFWKSEKNSKSLYSKLSMKPDENEFGPRHHLEKISYPEKIQIPEGAVEKGKLYRLNDCYYDHKGHFLYRVPGMTQG